MKKIILIILMAFISVSGFSQILFEGFEGAPATPDATGVWTLTSGNWLVRDNRTNANPNWRSTIASFPAYNGGNCAYVDRENVGIGVTSEEWLIMPQVTLPVNSQLRFFTRQTLVGDSNTTRYQIRISNSATQGDLASYTTIKDYSENDLSTLTSDQLDWEEKVIDLTASGSRYIAFVKVFTQPGTILTGDRWLVDDVKLVQKCNDPIVPLGANSISATGATITWSMPTGSTQTQYEVEYGPQGFVQGSTDGTLVPVTTSTRSYVIPSGLSPSTCYQFYVRAICPDSPSNWVGPFNFCTVPLGSTCAAPIVVPSIPYSDTSNTSLYGNAITAGSPGATGCGTTGAFLGGNDVVYSYTPTVTGNLYISMNPGTATNTGMFIYSSCANIGSSCIGGVANATANIRTITSQPVTAGVPIYIVLSSTTATTSYPYTLTIQEVTCPAPTFLPNGPFTTDSGTINWANGTGSTSTAWQVAVQLAGAGIPTASSPLLDATGTPSLLLTNANAGLVAATAYQYWVRADCGNGTYSLWSGPFLFNTTICDTAGCNYTFTVQDSFGDGWNGATMQVRQNGIVVATLTGPTSAQGTTAVTVTVPLCNNIPFDLFWNTAGTFPGEVRVSIKNSFNQPLYAITTASAALAGTVLYSGMVDCINPMCLAPTAVTVPVATISTNSATINWTSSGPPTTSWGIYVVPFGSPAPDLSTVPTYTVPGPTSTFTTPTTGPGYVLSPDTQYTVYVQSICSVNSPSPWTTTGVSFTTLPTCPKPTAVTITSGTISDTSFQVGWTPVGGTTAWQVLVLPSPSTGPLPTTGWIDVATTPSVLINSANAGIPIVAGTKYDIYVRSICAGPEVGQPTAPISVTTAICPLADQCVYTFSVRDSFGDGWNGATMQVRQNGIVVATLTGPTAAQGTTAINVSVALCNNIPFDLFWNTAGTFPGEVRVSISNSFSQVLYNMSVASAALAGTVLYSGTVDCVNPLCLPPTAVTVPVATVTTNSATINWTSSGVPTTSWGIYVVSFGSPAPDLSTVPTYTVPGPTSTFTIPTTPGLAADTQYTVYVQSICSVNSPSQWTATGVNFTTLPTCPKPTAVTIVAGTVADTSFQVSWTPAGSATAWQVLVLPSPSTGPLPTTGWIDASTNSLLVTNANAGIVAGTKYDVYVRSICAGPDIGQPTAPISVTTAICPLADQCSYIFTVRDSFGDSWNGATMQVRQNGIVVATITGPTAAQGTNPVQVLVPLCTGVPFELFWNTAGTFPGEVRISITNTFSQVLYNMSVASANLAGTVLYSGVADCLFPTCLSLTNPTVTMSTYSATLNWTPDISNNSFDVYVVESPAPAPTPTTTPTYTGVPAPPFTTTIPLTPNTAYQFYVRSNCAVGIPGPWVPVTGTTLPTCPKPTNLTNVSTLPDHGELTWTEVGTATSWTIVIQGVGGPVPGAGDGCLVTTLPTSTSPYNTTDCVGSLNAGFYEFYVKSNCSDDDISDWAGPVTFYVSPPQVLCAGVEVPNVTGDLTFCPGEHCVDLQATFTDVHDTTQYAISPVAFAPPFPFTGGTQLNIGVDDIWGPVFTLPFNFCFFGTNYPAVQVGSNGVISFTTTYPPNVGGGCPWNTDPAVNVPNTAFPIRNAIYGVYQDINPATATPVPHSINYQVLGQAPCRVLVVNFLNVAQFSCGADVGLQTSQIVLYETSNIIDVYIQDRTSCTTWNEGSGVVGIQNAAGTVGYVPPGRNLGTWEAHNEAWRFTPDGPSNVVFSWLKDGQPYSTDTNINVCVTQTTTMTAQAVYTGCGGQQTTKTKDVTLTVAPIDIAPINDVVSCGPYTLPALPLGNYFNDAEHLSPIADLVLTASQDVYVYAESTTPPVCSDLEQFHVEIVESVTPTFDPIANVCVGAAAPILPTTSLNGVTGTWLPPVVDTSVSGTACYVFTADVDCAGLVTLCVTIDEPLVPTFDAIADICLNSAAPDFPTTSTNGITGTWDPPTIDTSMEGTTCYAFTPDASFTCVAQTQLCVTISSQIIPGFTPIPAICQNTLAPELPATSTNGITGTWLPAVIDTGILGETCYTFTPDASQSCAAPTTLCVTVNSPITPDFTPIPNQCLGAVPPLLPLTSLNGITGTWSPAVIDTSVSGQTCYTFTPDATFTCALTATLCVTVGAQLVPTFDPIGDVCLNSIAPSLPLVSTNGITGTWSPATVDVSVIGTTCYTFTPDPSFACTSTASLCVTVSSQIIPIFTQIADICEHTVVSVPTLPTVSNNGITGTWAPPTIDTSSANTGIYVFTPDASQLCAIPTTMTIVVLPEITPTFAPIANICKDGVAPVLPLTSINGITGTWSPATIDTSVAGTFSYTFTPDGTIMCAIPATINVTIDAPIQPDFTSAYTICSGDTAPVLLLTSPNGVPGTWSPTVISNTASNCYVFTPNVGQCALTQTVCVTVNTGQTPDFAPIANICSGTTAPVLASSSPNGISGTWSPNVIDTNNNGCYVFTPNPGQCASTQTLCVTIDSAITPSLAPIGPICDGDPAPTLPATDQNGVPGTWSPSTVDNTQTGTYVFTPTGSCVAPASITITVGVAPSFTLADGCFGNDYQVYVVQELTDAHYNWTLNGTAIGGDTRFLSIDQPGTYAVTVNQGGCPDTVSRVVNATNCDIQKGISPKGTGPGDNKNDFFDLTGRNVRQLEIFNRYGTKVYSKGNYSNEWYGQSDKGDELPDGTYYYVIEYNNGTKSKTGWIYINRE